MTSRARPRSTGWRSDAVRRVTRGGEGVIAWHATVGQVEVPAPVVKVVDTIGAGDTFQGSLLVALREAGRIKRPALEIISRDELAAALAFGTRCAAAPFARRCQPTLEIGTFHEPGPLAQRAACPEPPDMSPLSSGGKE